MTTRPHESSVSERPARLHGKLGVLSISLIIIAGAAPLCVVGGPMALGLALGNGAGLPAAYLATLAVLLLFVLGFTTMTPFVRSAGAFYSYVHAGLGRVAGIGTGYLAVLSYTCIYIGLYVLLGIGTDALVTTYGGPSMPWWVWAAVGLAIIAFLGHRNVEVSGKVLGVLLVAEVGLVVVLNAAILLRGGGPEGLSDGVASLADAFSGAPGVALIFAVLSFIGIEAAAVFRDEAKDPVRTVRRATVVSVTVVGLFYAVTSWAVISGIGDSQVVAAATADPEGLLSSVALQYLGRVGADLIVPLFVTSTFAAALTWHNILSRYTLSLSSRELLPRRLAAVHPEHNSPHRGSLAVAAAVVVVVALAVAIGLDPMSQLYTWTSGLGSVGYVILLVLTCSAVLVYFRREPHETSALRTLVAPLLGLGGLLVILAAMLLNLDLLAGAEQSVSVAIIALLLGALVLGPVVGRLRPTAGTQE
ncbi:amino acid transporter [Nocardia neocaledoniensis NBRC 108232]|uniref:Amino acid/polyamine/organocation transporter (APC superfamily) n=1 Tax=Nocardia neocaledoniensis TaxID=236511 RepID=A0A317NHJ2_9NOCA|nr:amino acid/polyamine/organocation transporter (APC superfamily) [Nocardia neocaledoniensis]GEM29142.1 amino acid transporter [Nocardia neocaledoniensis NBRC 108232]